MPFCNKAMSFFLGTLYTEMIPAWMELTQINIISTSEDKNKGFETIPIYFTNIEGRLAFFLFPSFIYFILVMEINCYDKSQR